jgi:hypothetical protein
MTETQAWFIVIEVGVMAVAALVRLFGGRG